jgi:inorganic phosphate transporter, PiT family
MIEILLLLVVALLAYSNGANDNFKGVATLYGSGVLSFSRAKWLATAATIAGGITAIGVGQALLQAFSGRGLVPSQVVADPIFASAVAFAAAATVALATRVGMPISTTHALIGGLVGAGFVAVGSALKLSALGGQFLLPLILGPVLAFAITALLAAVQRRVTRTSNKAAAQGEACVCVTQPSTETLPIAGSAATAQYPASALPHIIVGNTQTNCAPQVLNAPVQALTTSRAVNAVHIVSGAAVCFARGLNDAPKIAALMLVAKSMSTSMSITSVALAMAIGGWLHSKKIAETMSHNITTLHAHSSVLANLCTSFLVIAASKFGLPLSTTHVSVGAISGLSIGAAPVNTRALKQIGLSWVLTLPCATLLGAISYFLLQTLLR